MLSGGAARRPVERPSLDVGAGQPGEAEIDVNRGMRGLLQRNAGSGMCVRYIE